MSSKKLEIPEEIKAYARLKKKQLKAAAKHKQQMAEINLELADLETRAIRWLKDVPQITITGVELKTALKRNVTTVKDGKGKPKTSELCDAIFSSSRNDLLNPNSAAIKSEFLKAMDAGEEHSLDDRILALLTDEESTEIKAKLI